jgi:hypothetical protein
MGHGDHGALGFLFCLLLHNLATTLVYANQPKALVTSKACLMEMSYQHNMYTFRREWRELWLKRKTKKLKELM